MIVAENIVKNYSNHCALNNVSLHVKRGSIFGLLGPNGAGKTSFIRILNQITRADSGTITINGETLNQSHIGLIGYLPEERGLYKKMKVGEQALYLAQLKGMSKADAKKELKIWFEKFEITTWWDKKVEELSKGMAQKVQFITTVLHKPQLLILDEPFSGFDPINIKLVREEIQRLKNEGATIILSTHNMASVEEICEEIALIDKSEKILEGEVSTLRRRFAENKFDLQFNTTGTNVEDALINKGYSILSKEETTEGTIATVKLPENTSVNQLLETVLPIAEIKGVQELLPSMSEIFIQAVNRK